MALPDFRSVFLNEDPSSAKLFLTNNKDVANKVSAALGRAIESCVIDTPDTDARSCWSMHMGCVAAYIMLYIDMGAFTKYISIASRSQDSAFYKSISILDLLGVRYPNIAAQYAYETYLKRAQEFIDMYPCKEIAQIERSGWIAMNLESRKKFINSVTINCDLNDFAF